VTSPLSARRIVVSHDRFEASSTVSLTDLFSQGYIPIFGAGLDPGIPELRTFETYGSAWASFSVPPVGWEPDLNDGVRLNIRPFVAADVLRRKPNVHWRKDRGKNPPSSPWGEERFNSYEEYCPGQKLTNAMKLAARQWAHGNGAQ